MVVRSNCLVSGEVVEVKFDLGYVERVGREESDSGVDCIFRSLSISQLEKVAVEACGIKQLIF